MMNGNLKISAWCRISDNHVVTGEGVLLSAPPSGTGEFLNLVYCNLGVSYPKYHKMDTLCKLGFLGSELLLRGKEQATRIPEKTGIILMNSSSSLDTDRKHQESIASRQSYFPSPSVFVYTLPNVVIGEICIRHKFHGEGCFLVSKEFDPELLYSYVSMVMNDGILECCLAGWVEANGGEYCCALFLVEKRGAVENGIINFSPAEIQSLYEKR